MKNSEILDDFHDTLRSEIGNNFWSMLSNKISTKISTDLWEKLVNKEFIEPLDDLNILTRELIIELNS